MIKAFICGRVYVLCTWVAFEILAVAPPGLDMHRIEAACRQAAESDRNGELVSVAVAGLTLRSSNFGTEIFLRGPPGILGYVTHHDPNLEAHCRALILRVVGWDR
jgi:hypothetical protein